MNWKTDHVHISNVNANQCFFSDLEDCEVRCKSLTITNILQTKARKNKVLYPNTVRSPCAETTECLGRAKLGSCFLCPPCPPHHLPLSAEFRAHCWINEDSYLWCNLCNLLRPFLAMQKSKQFPTPRYSKQHGDSNNHKTSLKLFGFGNTSIHHTHGSTGLEISTMDTFGPALCKHCCCPPYVARHGS